MNNSTTCVRFHQWVGSKTLFFLLSWLLMQPAWATTHLLRKTGGTAPSLAQALNKDGSLRVGANGSFNAAGYRVGMAPNGKPIFRPAGISGAGDEKWQDGFYMPGTDGLVYAVATSGTDVYVGGDFVVAGNVIANGIAKWNGSIWSNMGEGVSMGINEHGIVRTLAVRGSEVYVGGEFVRAGGVSASCLAKWNGTTWSPLGAGVDGRVDALALSAGGDLYVGGSFRRAGGMPVAYVAKWNGAAWSALGLGVNDFVRTLAVSSSGSVYVGGAFTEAGGVAVYGVAQWNGTAWDDMNSGLYITALVLTVGSNGDVYVGGYSSGGASVAKWNGTRWNMLGSGFTAPVNTTASIGALVVAGNGDVYAGGGFETAGGLPANGLAKWDGSAWSPLGSATALADRTPVYALATSGTAVYVSGSFNSAGGVSAFNLARWDGKSWSALGTGLDAVVQAVAVFGTDVYVGGGFTQAGDVIANCVAKWNGTTWSALGAGLNGPVRALAVAANGDLYVGGPFTQAGGAPANYVAKWNGTAWSPLGSGIGQTSNSPVKALAVAANGDLYVGGPFTQAGGAPANHVAKWDGTAWSPLGSGLNGDVSALAVSGTAVYAGGAFTEAGGVTANRIAKWFGGSWSSLGSGLANGEVLAVAVSGANVYAGGVFDTAGGVAANCVAKWNGTAWSPLGSGFTSTVHALAVDGLDVYAGGEFNRFGGGAPRFVAKWDGTVWGHLGNGLNGTVLALAAANNGDIIAGGQFRAVGFDAKVSYAFGIYSSRIVTSVRNAAPAAESIIYPNPADSNASLTLPPAALSRPVLVLDALSRLVRTALLPARAATVVLDLRGLLPGVYSVRCGNASVRLVVE